MNKRILSLVLALVMVLGTFAVVSAEEAKVPEYTSQDHKIQWLVDNEFVEGHEDGNLDLEGTLTREQATKLIVHIQGKKALAEVLDGVMKPFPDVDLEHWSNGVISVAATEKGANGQPIIVGFEDGLFRPAQEVTYAELATMLVRIVKDDLTDKMVENAIWATSWMRWAKEEKLLEGITITDSDAAITRADAFEMIFNTVKAKGDYNQGSVDFKDDMGIVSGLRSGIIEINQEKEYKIDASTKYTDGTTLSSLGFNADPKFVGSLVRYIVNEDGVVTHIMELGNKVAFEWGKSVPAHFGEEVKNRSWFDVADWTISAAQGTFVTAPANRKVYTDIKIGNETYELYSGTRYFVADVGHNALKEVKNLEELFTVYGLMTGSRVENLYMGFNKSGSTRTAKVVVFGKVEKYLGNEEMRRVTGFLNSAYMFQAEDEAGKVAAFDTSDIYQFPARDLLNDYDVVMVRDNKLVSSRLYKDFYVIEAKNTSDYPIVKVESKSGRNVTFRDVKNLQRQYTITRDLMTFTNGFAKDDVVQFRADETNKIVDVISVLPRGTALEGTLKNGVFVGEQEATKIRFTNGNYVIVNLDVLPDGTEVNETYFISDADKVDFARLAIGDKFYFDVRSWYNNVPVMTNIRPVKDQADLDAVEAAYNGIKTNKVQLAVAELSSPANKSDFITNANTALNTKEAGLASTYSVDTVDFDIDNADKVTWVANPLTDSKAMAKLTITKNNVTKVYAVEVTVIP